MFGVHREDATRGANRERRQLQAWLVSGVHGLLAELGLPNGWWCALEMPRAEPFEDGSSGDVDILAGPLELQLSPQEFDRRVQLATVASGPPFAEPLARLGAELDGLVVWPPVVGYTVAVEVKASYFAEGWGANHSGKAQKVLGALKRRAAYGINRVAFLHLAAATPSPDADTMERRSEIAGSVPLTCEPELFGRFGYAVAMMHVIESGTWGSMHGLDWRNRSELLSGGEVQSWHDVVRSRFAKMPRARTARTYIHQCPLCSSWMHAGSACPDEYCCPDCALSSGRCVWTLDALSSDQRRRLRQSAGLEPR